MKTVKLFQPVFWVILSLSLGFTALNAEGMKWGAGKYGSTMKVQSTKDKSEEKDIKKKTDKKKKVNTQNEWRVPQSKEKYQRGNIQTH